MNIAIVGGGASGLCCAIEAAKGGANVTIYESKDRVGKKILATGNGKCNITNLYALEHDYVNKGFAEYALNRYSPEKVVDFF